MTTHPLLKIFWVDTCCYTERNTKDYDYTLIPVETTGYLLREDKEKVVLYRDRFSYGETEDQIILDGVIVIPKGCITKREKL